MTKTKKALTPVKRQVYRAFDVADYLRDEEDVASYLEVAAEAGDAEHFARALGNVARARNLSDLARNTGISRQGLQKALSDRGNPSLATTMSVLNSLGLRMAIVTQNVPTAKKKVASKPKSRSAS